ncbi:hypothetical protein RHGRI_029390 [Rhododendron griersonianum]|uniref:Uncharacterized protein n=1 Tax=Rhododendron griersonianum TaxID=479676 RepID=A0AAV6IJ39_9ERIC|nr:hypothetical protein RHGRI_029390 [Rhododendron griersonianum]
MKTYEVGFKGLKRIGEVGVLNTLGIGEVGVLNTLDEPGKQMRSDVRIKNTSSSHVASSLLLHVPETGSHESSGDPNASDDHSDAANDASDGSSPGDDSKNEVDDADFDVFNHVDSD